MLPLNAFAEILALFDPTVKLSFFPGPWRLTDVASGPMSFEILPLRVSKSNRPEQSRGNVIEIDPL
jgi:hypothetical protein